MQHRKGDWLRVVYGAGLEAAPGGARRGVGDRTELAVRQVPAEIDLSDRAGHREQRVRVTVVPSDPGQGWELSLRDFGSGPGDAPGRRVWWRLDPGTWQPLAGTRQCVAQGRGRVRLDVALRLEPGAEPVRPRLRFVAETVR